MQRERSLTVAILTYCSAVMIAKDFASPLDKEMSASANWMPLNS
jgi:hypothetical protein